MVRFYLVEDDVLIRDGLRDYFPWQNLGAEIIGVSDNGATAFKEIMQCEVDVVLTDVVLPGMSGIEMAKALRQAGWKGQLIIISAYQDVAYLKGALQTQAVDFLFKPFSTDELMRCVQQTIERINLRIEDDDAWRKPLRSAIDSCDGEQVYAALLYAWQIISTYPLKEGEKEEDRGPKLFNYCASLLPYEPGIKMSSLAASSLHSTGSLKKEKMMEWASRLRDLLIGERQEWIFAARITQQIRENITEVDPQSLADCMGISRASLYRQFNSVFSVNLNDYITSLRMQEACRLLLESDAKIYDISHRVGYMDVNYFTRQFRRMNHCLPSEYRKRNKPG